MNQAADETALQAQARHTLWKASRRRALLLDRASRAVTFVVVGLFATLFIFPIYWMLATALKPDSEVFQIPPIWWPTTAQWQNLWNVPNPANSTYTLFAFWHYVWNTAQITIPATIGTTLSSSLAAYGFSRVRWKGRDLIFYLTNGASWGGS